MYFGVGSLPTLFGHRHFLLGGWTVPHHQQRPGPLCRVGSYHALTGQAQVSIKQQTDNKFLVQQDYNTVAFLQHCTGFTNCGIGPRCLLPGLGDPVNAQICIHELILHPWSVFSLVGPTEILFDLAGDSALQALTRTASTSNTTHCGVGPRFPQTGPVVGGIATTTEDPAASETQIGVDSLTDSSTRCALDSQVFLQSRTPQQPEDSRLPDQLSSVTNQFLGVGSHYNFSLTRAFTIQLFLLGVGSLAPFSLALICSVIFSIFSVFYSIYGATKRLFHFYWTSLLLAQRTALEWSKVRWSLAQWLCDLLFQFFWHTVTGGLRWFFSSAPGIQTLWRNFDRRSGPKSRRWHWFCIFGCAALLYSLLIFSSANRGEGCTLTMEGAEASRIPTLLSPPETDAKPHGTQPTMRAGAPMALKPKPHPKVVKRSLHRAQRRAQAHGMTWYRGQCMTPNDFLRMGMKPIPTDLPPPRPSAIAHCHSHNAPKKRLLCAAWNGGGLAIHRLDELKHWLHVQRIQVAVISETRWSFQSTWSDNVWHHIHSADPSNRGSGVLILVVKSLCNAADLRWNELIPGRFVHVRLMMPTRNIDILGCYQHVYTRANSCLHSREQFWKALDSLLMQIPNRNTLALLGDMNCSLPPSNGICGTASFRWRDQLVPGTTHPDANRFLSILKQHGLVALNTWDSSQGPSFASQGGVSRIDYFCTRKQFADGKARTTQYLWDAPFMPLAKTGHAVLIGHIAMYWIPTTSQQFGLTPHQKMQGRLAKMAQSDVWQQYVATIGPELCSHFTLALTSEADDLLHIHEHALASFSRFFPATSKATCPSPWQLNPVTTNKWTHRKMLTQIQGHSMSAFFRAWFHVCRFMTLNRQHRRFAHHLRRLKFEELLQEACKAATKHDTHRLFDLINRHSPKAPKRRLQLRNDQGHLITPSEERSLLIAFVRDTWRGDPLPMPAPGPPTGVPFTIQDLVAALKLIPTGKAVAAPCAPGPTWNSTADMIAPVLYAILNRWWSHDIPWIPASWRSGWLQLIPKPNKPPVRPANLRPLAMMCPLGKAVMGLLIQMASRQADGEFRRWPIWAFMAHRSTQDPLAKVALHCRAARQLVLSQRSTPHTRAMQTRRMPICGGLQVFIDLERGFRQCQQGQVIPETIHPGDWQQHHAHPALLARGHCLLCFP